MNKQNKIRIIITDDHKMFREGISLILGDREEIEVLSEAGSGEELLDLLSVNAPHVILMDINLPGINGIEATKFIKKNYPEINILALSTSDDENYIAEILNNGATGYVLKSSGIEELIAAIKTVARGNSYFCKEASNVIMKRMSKIRTEKKNNTESQGTPLSEREVEVLKLIAEGLSNKEIAGKLYISVRTVDTHRRNLFQKLNVKNSASLVNYAIKHNLLH